MSTFTDFAHAHGLELPPLYASERVQRCGTIKHPRQKNGAYFWDGHRGWVSDWSNGGDIYWFDDPKAKEWSEQDRKEWAERKRAKEHDMQMGWRAAAERAQELLKYAKPDTHYYLNAKGLPDALGQVVETTLIVPMRHLHTNALQGVQLIDWVPEERRYQKKMNYGMRARGAVFRLGSHSALTTILCEGYATGLSIEKAVRQMRLNASVLICFSDSNMVHVASMVKGRAYIFADHDKSQAGEIAAKKTGLPYCMSEIEGEDANDYHQRAGIMSLCQIVMGLQSMEIKEAA